jgi:membrane protein involved in colicin uptake
MKTWCCRAREKFGGSAAGSARARRRPQTNPPLDRKKIQRRRAQHEDIRCVICRGIGGRDIRNSRREIAAAPAPDRHEQKAAAEQKKAKDAAAAELVKAQQAKAEDRVAARYIAEQKAKGIVVNAHADRCSGGGGAGHHRSGNTPAGSTTGPIRAEVKAPAKPQSTPATTRDRARRIEGFE